MRTTIVISLLLSAVTAVPHLHPRAANYEGFKVYRVDTEFESVSAKMSGLNFERWNSDTSKHMDFSLSPEEAEKFRQLGLGYEILHQDLGRDLATEGRWSPWKGKLRPEDLPDESWYDSYHSYDDHLAYLGDLQSAFSKKSEIFTAGQSVEGRDQVGLHIWGKDGPDTKPAILLHGTVHAREWITTMTVEYIAYQLIATYGKNPHLTSFVDDYDWYIIPAVNPDGFVHTQTKDRLWRKNRLPPLPGADQSADCWGVDLNRNWPIEWDSNPAGSSPDPCEEDYRGQSPGDQIEMQTGMAGFAHTLGEMHGIKLFIDFHSYGQLILSPYGYSCDVYPMNDNGYQELMNATAAALEDVHGTTYAYGPTCQTIYPTNGDSMDYISAVVGGEWAIGFELRGGQFGFVLPPAQILPNCEEIWAGMRVMLAKM